MLVRSFLLCFTLPLLGASQPIRGVPLEKLSFYVPDRDFTCLDGKNIVPFSFVNDDYCDCADGSDEPGTSACPNSKYFCRNVGHESEFLLSSRVNDGICDCCDGSDEWGTSAECPDTCAELGRIVEEERRRKRELEELGRQKKGEYVKRAADTKGVREEELTLVQRDLEMVESEVEVLRQVKEDAEAPEKEAKDKHKEEWEQALEEQREAKKEKMARRQFDELDANSDSLVTSEELTSHIIFDDDRDGEVSLEEARQYLGSQDSVDFDAFLKEHWDVMADKFDEEPEEDSDEDSDEGDEQMPEYDEATKELIAVADKARSDLREAESRKRELERKKEDLERYLGMSFGEENEYAPLYEECYEYTHREYTYKLCMFQKVTQRSKSGGRETSLGNWDAWDGPEDQPFSAMKYSNGEKCWNGPNRSCRVLLQCGAVEELLSANEPDRCQYEVEFTTPAACTTSPTSSNFPHVEL